MRPLRIGVIGPAGFGGSYLCLELINRGHFVVGISRSPEKLGIHGRYRPLPTDINMLGIMELAEAFLGLDVLVNEYGPHSAGHEALEYMPFLEVTRKVILAVKHAHVPYFVMVGGAGSLFMPGGRYESVLENKAWWMAYRRGIADSDAHTSYMEERLGPMGTGLRKYRNARASVKNGTATTAEGKTIDEYETYVKNNDAALKFITGCRTSFMMFDGNTSYRWSFVSPPALYRPGKRTGKYEVGYDYLPLKGEANDAHNLDDRLHGISAADLAIAIADEAEAQDKVGRHWTAFSDLTDDTVTPSYVTLAEAT